ncbi:hypothetical protein CJ178_17360 [Rhodococcus sp. ACPA4]|nr:hypothetical protein CJ178_17360 [Rhodococcus sp. ACPA4]QXW00002.1 riboflavin kinase [Rhodococcus globerulus]
MLLHNSGNEEILNPVARITRASGRSTLSAQPRTKSHQHSHLPEESKMATESATPLELLAHRVTESCSTPDTHGLPLRGGIFNTTKDLVFSRPVHGVVIYGDQRGRQLGFPTANVPVDDRQAVPADGVYAGWLRRTDTRDIYPAAISVGTNPTFEGVRDRRIESYVLDRTDLELYGVAVEIAFVAHVRDVKSFDSIDALIVQMSCDVETIRRILVRADYVTQDA